MGLLAVCVTACPTFKQKVGARARARVFSRVGWFGVEVGIVRAWL